MKRVLLALIRFYRRYISPAFPGKCRFIPTCSEYGLEAIEKYGALKGGWLTIVLIAAYVMAFQPVGYCRRHHRL